MADRDGVRPAAATVPEDARLAHAFVEAVEALLCIVGPDGRILFTNPALQRFTGLTAADLLGQRFWDVWVVPEEAVLAAHAVRTAVDSGVAHPQEGDWIAAGGERRRVAMRNTVLYDDDGRAYAVASVGIDVTDDRAREARLHHQTRTDALTGVANRAALFEALHARLEGSAAPGCGLLFCDLDDFKTVNDVHGHATGDRLLVEAAARLVEVAGPGHLVTRFGGDEFVILCPAGDEQELRALSTRVGVRLAAPFPGPDGALRIGVSVGAAIGKAGESGDDVIARADRAMYGAKSHQRRRKPRSS
ncbi:sensor domain-containing diguanylate cyclase [Blastococcus sp. LR1]|uniref:sensor domain-containing diguanylate cyclase n=1 Tax=Blastococcus sp. LR1 TaxID=2877000 RepID=UPI001CCB32DA|nr:sensor domain-containing diguanylate cyclase [Blastococcus sp. LR1]MCA0146970.1 sensor domain-containing diguanylate cyclase [Blastococcus sp. LR1]